ncbi:hypothetical protein F2Q69_00020175 [Brassica cretica]|uniref:Agenet domain-containing protein n=1 Tax=Brassica cretica TaxID=69181 RepID=A0A8S9Q9T0_BRACR|nr:hypothetical protein F2Q69_00020175 [Brassica cretica]
MSHVPSTACIQDSGLVTMVEEPTGAHQTPMKKSLIHDDTARNRDSTQQSHLNSNRSRKRSSDQINRSYKRNNPHPGSENQRDPNMKIDLLLNPKADHHRLTTEQPSHHEARRPSRPQNRLSSRAENFPELTPKPRSVSISTESQRIRSNSEGEAKTSAKEKVAVTLFADQKRVTVTADKIRPKPPADDREKKFEMMDNVEAFYSKGWSSGQVRMILGENTFSVYLNSSMETLEFKASDLRIHRKWLDGVWKMADETASRQDEANSDQTQQYTKEPTNENISQNISDTQRLTRARAKILREQNKIASKYEDKYVKWYPGIVLKTDIRNGVEMLKVEYSTRFRDKEKRTKKLQESVSIDSIHPQPPPGDIKGFELMDKVQAYHNDGWCSGEVHIILSNDIYYVRFNSSTEFIQFNLSDPRIPKEWVDGVWKMGKEIEVQQTQSVKSR